MKNIFYNKSKNHIIVDISGKLTLAQIKQPFNKADYQSLTIDNTKEGYHIKNGLLVKYNLADEQQAQLQAEQDRQKILSEKANTLKTKLGLTDTELNNLKEILR